MYLNESNNGLTIYSAVADLINNKWSMQAPGGTELNWLIPESADPRISGGGGGGAPFQNMIMGSLPQYLYL